MWLVVALACGHRLSVNENRWVTPHGDLVMTCALDTCNLTLDGRGRPRSLATDLWTPDVPASITEAKPGLWLLEVTQGDACPSMYRLICPASRAISGIFGNCNEVADIVDGSQTFVRFDASLLADRHAHVYRLDRDACETLQITAGD